MIHTNNLYLDGAGQWRDIRNLTTPFCQFTGWQLCGRALVMFGFVAVVVLLWKWIKPLG